MKASRGSRVLAPFILNLGSRWEIVVNLTFRPPYHRLKALVLIERASELAWVFLRGVFPAHTRIRIADFPARKLSHYTDYALAVPAIAVGIKQKQQTRKKKITINIFINRY